MQTGGLGCLLRGQSGPRRSVYPSIVGIVGWASCLYTQLDGRSARQLPIQGFESGTGLAVTRTSASFRGPARDGSSKTTASLHTRCRATTPNVSWPYSNKPVNPEEFEVGRRVEHPELLGQESFPGQAYQPSELNLRLAFTHTTQLAAERWADFPRESS